MLFTEIRNTGDSFNHVHIEEPARRLRRCSLGILLYEYVFKKIFNWKLDIATAEA